MRYITFRKWQAIIGMIIGGITGASVAMGNWIIPVFTIIICILIMMVLRRKVQEIVNDERTYAIAEKAARLTLQIMIFGMAITGAILLVISHGKYQAMTQAGFALEYATCALLIINYLAYYYYSKKLGGR
jgi:uncharacterized membrane protein